MCCCQSREAAAAAQSGELIMCEPHKLPCPLSHATYQPADRGTNDGPARAVRTIEVQLLLLQLLLLLTKLHRGRAGTHAGGIRGRRAARSIKV